VKVDRDDARNATFILTHQDHTLANSLRYVLAKNPDVDFVGYSIPHPSDPKVNIRLQTKRGAATDVFQQGLEQLQEITAHIQMSFDAAMSNHDKK